MNTGLRAGALVLLASSLLPADVGYSEDVKFQGGTMVEMVQKMASMPMIGRLGGGSLKQAFEDQHFDVFVKGNKMARLGKLNSVLYDLDAGTITTIDNTHRTYSTVTFEEMKQHMEQAQQRMNRHSGSGDVDFDVKVDNTGQTRTINGQLATEMIVTMTAKQATAQGQMVVKSDDWLTPAQPGSEELRAFQKKLAEKYAYAMVALPGSIAGASKGLSEAMKQAMSQDRFPVLMDMTLSGVMDSSPMAGMGGGNSDPNAPMLKMETQNGNLSTDAVDDSKFSLPAGYKQEKRSH